MLELTQHSHASFVTLTYTPEALPSSSTGLPTLDPKHTQTWLKRLRTTLTRSPAILADLDLPDPYIRYFIVGEYGDKSDRPHYHAALFGYPSCQRGRTRFSQRTGSCCPACDLILKTWSHGNVFLGDLTRESAAYVAGYVTKKMTSKDDPRLNGRHPEFARMSLKPAIGLNAMHEVASSVLHHEVDAPQALRHGSATLPLGRYLTDKLREFTGNEKDEEIYKEEMRSLSYRAIASGKGAKQQHLDETKTRALSQTRLSKIRNNNRETL